MNLKKKIAMGILVLCVIAFPMLFRTGYVLQFGVNIMLYAFCASAWNIIGGYAGQLALGNGVYFGIGAFVSGVLFVYEGISPWIGMLIAGLIAGLISLIIGSITFRLQGSYFALSTVALLHVVRMLFVSNTHILGYKTNGALGLIIPWRNENFWNMQFLDKTWYYYIMFGLLVVGILISRYINKSKMGYYLSAINTNPEAAGSLGVHVKGMKLKAGFISAFLTAIGGTFYAMVIQVVDPSRVLGYDLSVQIMLYAVVGGRGTLWGPILAATIMVPMNDLLRAYLGSSMAGLSLVIYGLMLCLIIFFMPEGLWKPVSNLLNKIFGDKKSDKETA